MGYEPKYDIAIKTKTVTNQVETDHTDSIDWDFPFSDLEHLSCRCANDESKKEELERQRVRLKFCENNIGSRIYGNFAGVYTIKGVAMASRWPFWKPMPYVIIERVFLSSTSYEHVLWLDLGKPITESTE